jgi:Tol biopolymer transport system component
MKPTLVFLSLGIALQVSSAFRARAANLITSSTNGSASVSANGNSFAPSFSGNGRVAFISHAANITTNPPSSDFFQVFVYDLVSNVLTLVSITTNKTAGEGNSTASMMSSNGQFVVFASEADMLTRNETNLASDVFVRDLDSGATRLVSADLSGRSPLDDVPPMYFFPPSSIIPLSGNPIVSASGRWVVFESRATNLTFEPYADPNAFDTNGVVDIFARDLQSNKTVLVTRSFAGPRAANAVSSLQSISADGQRIAFLSSATDLVSGVSNTSPWKTRDVFARDTVSNVTLHVSSSLTNHMYGYECRHAAISDDGRSVAFTVWGAHDNFPEVLALYLRDLNAPAPILIATGLSEGTNSVPQISADGRYVAYGDGTNVWRYDALAGTNQLVNVTMSGNPPIIGSARRPLMTPDGRGVVFISDISDLTTNGSSRFQIYARDMELGRTRLVSAATNGTASGTSHEFSLVSVAPDFFLVAFDSSASDLASGDGNGASDVFVRSLASETTVLISRRDTALTRESGTAHSFVFSDNLSADGRFVVFSSFDNDLIPGDTNGRPDIFIRDVVTGMPVTPGFSTNATRSPSISADGRYVSYLRRAVSSSATTNGGEVWRFDRVAGTNELITSNSTSVRPAISRDGNLIAYLSNGVLRLRDMNGGTNDTIAPASPAQGRDAAFTPDGRFLIFVSASALTTNAGSYPRNLYAWDRIRQSVRLISESGDQGAGTSGAFSISSNSQFVAWNDYYRYLTYRYDLFGGTNQLVRDGILDMSINGDGTLLAISEYSRLLTRDLVSGEEIVLASGPRFTAPLLSADGRFLIYSQRTAAWAGDYSYSWYRFDLYVRDRLRGVTTLLNGGPPFPNPKAPDGNPVLSADGRTLVFQSAASDLAPGDFNDKLDVFLVKLAADADGDGMDDDWEATYFGNLSRDGTGDFDGDSSNDRAEFLAGTDPTNDGSLFRVLTVAPVGGGARQLIWSGNPAGTYRAEFKDDLSASNWTRVAGTISWNGSTASIIDTTATNSAQRYYRAVRLP